MRSEQSLSRLENHLVVYFKQFVYKEPGTVRAEFRAISILQDPVPLIKQDAILVEVRVNIFKVCARKGLVDYQHC